MIKTQNKPEPAFEESHHRSIAQGGGGGLQLLLWP